MLEHHQIAAHIPPRTLDKWKPTVSGLIGRKDLEQAANAGHMLGRHSQNYYFWIRTPGADLPEFLDGFAQVLIAD
jgi:hypothetical protein